MTEFKDLYKLDKKDIDKASGVLARAFHDDADLVKLLPDEGVRRRKLPLMFKPFVKFGILYGEVYSPTSDIEGISLWNHSSMKDITFIRSLRSGFLGLMSKLDGKERKMFQRYGKEMDRFTKDMIKEEHWFLFILGIDPKNQRKGFGTMLLEPMLERLDSEKLPAMLDTNKKANLGFYGRFGFKVHTDYKVLDNQHWGLVRYPRDPVY